MRLKASLGRRRDIPTDLLSEPNLERFAAVFRDRLRDANKKLGKRYVRQFVERVEVGDHEIRINGSKAALANALLETNKPGTEGVPGFVRGWWAHKDSNLGPAD